jgi:hypothetical protein
LTPSLMHPTPQRTMLLLKSSGLALQLLRDVILACGQLLHLHRYNGQRRVIFVQVVVVGSELVQLIDKTYSKLTMSLPSML